MNKVKKIFVWLLNTPEKDWLIVFGYHIHKAFWGVVLIILGILFITKNHFYFGIILTLIGLLLIVFDIIGHINTNNKPYFILWNKHPKQNV